MSIIGALILLFVLGQNEPLMAVGDPLRNNPRSEKLAASTAPESGGWIGFEVSARKRSQKSDGVRLH